MTGRQRQPFIRDIDQKEFDSKGRTRLWQLKAAAEQRARLGSGSNQERPSGPFGWQTGPHEIEGGTTDGIKP